MTAGRSTAVWAVAAAVAGVAIGIAVDLRWPNTVYGYQMVAALGAIALAVVAFVARRGHRLVLPLAGGLALGVIAGIALGLALARGQSAAQVGSLELDLAKPEILQLETTTAMCTATDGRLTLLETANDEDQLRLSDGRHLVIRLTAPATPAVPDVPMVEIHVISSLPDGSPTETWLTSGPGSVVSASGTDASGSVAFSGMTLHPDSEQRTPIDLAGSITWACP